MGRLFRTAGLVLLMAALLSPTVAQAQQELIDEEGYYVDIAVFYDDNANGIWDPSDDYQISGWNLEVYDAGWNLTGSDVSSDVNVTTIVTVDVPTYICAVPQTGWIQTYPASGTNYPATVAWFCYDFDLAYQQEVYEFGVTEESEIPEDIGKIIEEETTEPEETPGQVLGIVSEPQVLAETGSPAAIAPLFGLLFLLIALKISKKPLVQD